MSKFVKFICGEPSVVTTVSKQLPLEYEGDSFT